MRLEPQVQVLPRLGEVVTPAQMAAERFGDEVLFDPPVSVAPYATAGRPLTRAGWFAIVLPPRAKDPPPIAFTGYRAKPVNRDDVKRWEVSEPNGNVAIRLPGDVIGIDVDNYDLKRGAEDLRALEEQHGALPPTWSSTSRPGTGSGIRLFRVPMGTRFPPALSSSIEIVQAHHRYVIVSPSIHPEGRVYHWYDTGGERSDNPPAVDDVAELPWAWIEALSLKGPVGFHGDPATTEQVDGFIDTHTERRRPAALKGIQTSLNKYKETSPGKLPKGRHDTLVERACQVAREAAAGWYTADEGFGLLRRWFEREMDDQRRLDGTEVADALAWGIGQANAEPDRITLMREEARQRAAGPAPNVDPATGEIDRPVQLPAEFWAARPVLAHIRQAAQSRGMAPDAVLGCILARVAAMLDPELMLPPTLAASSSMSFYAAVIGSPAAGKSAARAVAAELLPCDLDRVAAVVLGSGEGIVEAFFDWVDEVGPESKVKKVKKQTRTGLIVSLDEGQALADLGKRNGSTLLATLRTMWTGDEAGASNAAQETKRHLKARSYTVGLIVGFQPGSASGLIDDVAGGTPQRFEYLNAVDTTLVEPWPTWPGTLEWEPPPPRNMGSTFTLAIDVATPIATELRNERTKIVNGELTLDALDSHHGLARLKVAGLLAVLEGRTNITVDDWALAAMFKATSARVRAGVVGHLADVERQREQATTHRLVRRDAAIADNAISRTVERCAKAVGRRVHREGEVTRGEAWRSLASRDRQAVTIDEIVEHAISLRWVATDGDMLLPGEARPT